MLGWNRRAWTIFALIAAGLILSAEALGHGFHPEQASELEAAGPLTYVKAGAIHMLTGYDHLLFLFGVMFFLTSFRDIVTFITAFTIGHSITLIFATYYEIQANAYLIDAVIAISVIYKGFDNLEGFQRWFETAQPNLLAMVFGFGLIHGFGLSTRVQDLGLPEDGLLLRLLAFNAGVELGQIAALVAMTLALALFRQTAAFRPFSKIANTTLVLAGCCLFLLQMHAYLHTTYPNDFGFNSIDHYAEHESVIITVEPKPGQPLEQPKPAEPSNDN